MEGLKGRRRGAALEEAILDATWAELAEHGYAAMTLDAVAKRAGTSRPVLFRRWPSRAQLAAAAVARYIARNPVEVPDLGDVCLELRRLLRLFIDRARPDLIRVLIDMGADLADADSNLAEVRTRFVTNRPIHAILDRAIARGEVDPDRLTPRVVALPTDLARHEMLMTLQPPSDDTVREIIEDIFLPLVRRSPTSGAGPKP